MKRKELEAIYGIMFSDYPDVVTVAQLQKMLGVSRHLVYELIHDGNIGSIKIGNSFKIPKFNVINYIMKQGDESDEV